MQLRRRAHPPTFPGWWTTALTWPPGTPAAAPRSTRPPRPTIPARPTHCWPGERIPAHSTMRGRPQIRRHASTGTPRRSPWRPVRRSWRRAFDMGTDVSSRRERGPGGYWGGDVTPLHLAAAWTRDPAVIPLLVEAGADVNARDDRGFSPLHAAARLNENEAVIRALLAAGAELDAWATGFSVDYGWEATPLLEAAESNANPAVIATLLDAGADASVRGWGGETLLHRAARGGSPDVVSLLLRAGADVNAVDGGGSTPLHEAARRNPDPAVVELLLDAGADVHVVGSGTQASTGWGPSTPLHLAAGYNPESAVVAVLLAAGRTRMPAMKQPAVGRLCTWRPREAETGRSSGSWSPQAQTSARGPGPVRLRFTWLRGRTLRWFLCCWSLVRICTRWMTRGRRR